MELASDVGWCMPEDPTKLEAIPEEKEQKMAVKAEKEDNNIQQSMCFITRP